jgi:hypothetical protein
VDSGVDRVAPGRARVWLLASRQGAYRARPRLRRRFSAALSLRGFGRAFDPARLPSASIGALSRWPFGARRRASRQMNSEIPPSTTIAPIAMMIAELPVNPLPLPAVAVVWIVGVAVVEVGIETDGCGKPPLSGLVVWAPADAGSVSATGPTSATAETAPAIATNPASNTRRTDVKPRPLRRTRPTRTDPPYASGCSIAGVSGAET